MLRSPGTGGWVRVANPTPPRPGCLRPAKSSRKCHGALITEWRTLSMSRILGGRTTVRRAAAALAVAGVVMAGGLGGFGPSAATASSHREAPGIAEKPTKDNTDVYAFVSK